MKKNFQKLSILLISLTPNFILATSTKQTLVSPLGEGGNSDISSVLLNLANVAQTILIMLSTLYLIYSGFVFVIAKGDPEKIKKAKRALLWGLIGVALILSAEVLAHGIEDTVKEVFKTN